MIQLFTHSTSSWVRYDKYMIRKADNGKRYLTAADGAVPTIINPFEEVQQMALDAINIGIMVLNNRMGAIVEQAIIRFASHYGMLGLMTALPTTARFMDYFYVYLPKNDFIREESMDTQAYTDLFFPFRKPTYRKDGDYVEWDIEGDVPIQALMLTLSQYDTPIATQMTFLREYAEDLIWVRNVFRAFAFNFLTTLYYYSLPLSEEERASYRYSMQIFEGAAPTCHLELWDKPVVMWDYHSLLLGLQMAVFFTITDPKSPIHLCKNCEKAFFASRPNQLYCSGHCRRYYRKKHPTEREE